MNKIKKNYRPTLPLNIILITNIMMIRQSSQHTYYIFDNPQLAINKIIFHTIFLKHSFTIGLFVSLSMQ